MKRVKKFYNEHFKSLSLGLAIVAIVLYVLPSFAEFVFREEEYKVLVLLVLVVIYLKFLVDKTELIDEKLTKTYNA